MMTSQDDQSLVYIGGDHDLTDTLKICVADYNNEANSDKVVLTKVKTKR